MSRSPKNHSSVQSGAYDQAVQRMEQFVRDTDCLQGIHANRDDFLLRLDSLSIQRKNLEGALLIVILGGTGVGKSTLINAIAGEEVAKVSPIRPCTTALTFYSHRENDPSLIDAVLKEGDHWTPNDSPGLRRKILVDPPDFDSMMLSNRRKLLEVLRVADLVLCVVDPEKYRNHSLYRLLSRFREGRSFLFLMNKSDYGIEQAVVDDFRESLVAAGIDDPTIFVASARNAFRRKTEGEPGADDGAFPALEAMIRDEIDRAEIERIKRSNFVTLLQHTHRLIDQVLPTRLIPDLKAFPEFTQNLARDTAARVAAEVSRTLVVENDKMRRFLQSAGSLSIGGIFGLYLGVTDKLSSLVAPRLSASRALDPMALRSEVQKAIDRTDTSRIEILIDRFSTECATRIGAAGVRPDSPDVKELTPDASEVGREISRRANEFARGAVEDFVGRSSKGWWNNIVYNILPVGGLAYFIWLAVLRIGRGDMLDGSFLLTFLVVMGAICVLQHVLAERGFRRRGGRFIRQLEKGVEDIAQKTMEEETLPPMAAFSATVTDKIQGFLKVKNLIR